MKAVPLFLSPSSSQTLGGSVVANITREERPPCVPRRKIRLAEDQHANSAYQVTEVRINSTSSVPSFLLLGPSDFKDVVVFPQLVLPGESSKNHESPPPQLLLKPRPQQSGTNESPPLSPPRMGSSSLRSLQRQPVTVSKKRQTRSSGVPMTDPVTPTINYARCA